MRKWLNDSPLWSTFLAKEQEVKVSLLTNSKFFLPGDFRLFFPLLCVTAALLTVILSLLICYR